MPPLFLSGDYLEISHVFFFVSCLSEVSFALQKTPCRARAVTDGAFPPLVKRVNHVNHDGFQVGLVGSQTRPAPVGWSGFCRPLLGHVRVVRFFTPFAYDLQFHLTVII